MRGPSPLAFGLEPARSRYFLRQARYVGLSEEVQAYLADGAGGAKFRLLDVGLGRGRTMRYLDSQGVSDRIEYYGIDESGERVHQPERWHLKQADVEDGLPYQDRFFDIVICEQVLEHLDNPAFVLGEMARVTKPRGLLIVGVPTFPPVIAHVRRLCIRMLRQWMGIRRDHIQTFTCRSGKAMIEGTNRLAVTKLRGFRIMSGGPLTLLERFEWWYRLNRRLGERLPSLCIEVQYIVRAAP